MPVSSGVRSRPQIGMTRSINMHRLGVSGVAQILPKAMILPIMLAAMATVAVATLWTYGIHTEASLALIGDPITTGTVTETN